MTARVSREPGGVSIEMGEESVSIKNNTLLLKDGCWELRFHEGTFSGLTSYIAHRCPDCTMTFYWYALSVIDSACHLCKEYPPKDLMGLWKLHNMDYIQKGRSH